MSLDSGSNNSGVNDFIRILTSAGGLGALEICHGGGGGNPSTSLRQQLKVAKIELVENKSKLKVVEEQLAVNMGELTNVRN
ncbi:hypothetical protein RSAG8_09827, partial [Rhizoctonia solani AG-8 WAC10335]